MVYTVKVRWEREQARHFPTINTAVSTAGYSMAGLSFLAHRRRMSYLCLIRTRLRSIRKRRLSLRFQAVMCSGFYRCNDESHAATEGKVQRRYCSDGGGDRRNAPRGAREVFYRELGQNNCCDRTRTANVRPLSDGNQSQ